MLVVVVECRLLPLEGGNMGANRFGSFTPSIAEMGLSRYVGFGAGTSAGRHGACSDAIASRALGAYCSRLAAMTLPSLPTMMLQDFIEVLQRPPYPTAHAHITL